jgi:hypothetical protein
MVHEELAKLLEHSLVACYPNTQCTSMKNESVFIHDIKRVHNSHLEDLYVAQRNALRRKLAMNRLPYATSLLIQEQLSNLLNMTTNNPIFNDLLNLDPSLNEVLLFHGCSAANAQNIALSVAGFPSFYFGRGKYCSSVCFAENLCESDKTSPADEATNRKYVIVAKVLLGHPSLIEGEEKSTRSNELNYHHSSWYCDSVISTHMHRQFYILDRSQALPVWIIEYSTMPKRTAPKYGGTSRR